MNKITCVSVFLCLGLLFQPGTLSAQTTTLTPAQQKYLLEKAAEIEAAARKNMQANHSSVVHIIQRAAGNPNQAIKIYLDAVEDLDFTQAGKKESEFRAWRDRRQEQFRDDHFAKTIQLQAQYILLTLEVMESTTDEDLAALLPKVLTYVGRVNELKPMDRGGVLNRSLNSSYIVRRLNLNLSGNINPAWVMTPGDTQRIYESFIFPSIIKLENVAMLKEAWEFRLAQERAIAQKTNNLEEFNTRHLAELHWKRAKDFNAIGDLDNGLLRMLTLLQSNTQHPKAMEWSQEFQDLINNANPQN